MWAAHTHARAKLIQLVHCEQSLLQPPLFGRDQMHLGHCNLRISMQEGRDAMM